MTEPEAPFDVFGSIARALAANDDTRHADAAARRAAEHAERELRVSMLLRLSSEVLAGQEPKRSDLVYCCSAIQSWLSSSGSLDHALGLANLRGKSKATPQAIALRLRQK